MPERLRPASPGLRSPSPLWIPCLGLTLLVLWTACSRESPSGPGEIKWDRQTCERCQMVVSERRFAVQLRGEHDHRLHAFDDLGCALLWLDEQSSAGLGERPEIWVRDAANRRWLDGRRARYGGGHRTPMRYGYAVTEAESEGALALPEVREQVRSLERMRRRPGE